MGEAYTNRQKHELTGKDGALLDPITRIEVVVIDPKPESRRALRFKQATSAAAARPSPASSRSLQEMDVPSFFAGRASTTSPGLAIRLSSLICDPDVRATFWRAERHRSMSEGRGTTPGQASVSVSAWPERVPAAQPASPRGGSIRRTSPDRQRSPMRPGRADVMRPSGARPQSHRSWESIRQRFCMPRRPSATAWPGATTSYRSQMRVRRCNACGPV